jgi:hypothetical protein
MGEAAQACKALHARFCRSRLTRRRLVPAQEKFTRGWGVGLAIDQATQMKDLFITALRSAAVITVLETLWLVSNRPWLEELIGARLRAAGEAAVFAR